MELQWGDVGVYVCADVGVAVASLVLSHHSTGVEINAKRCVRLEGLGGHGMPVISIGLARG